MRAREFITEMDRRGFLKGLAGFAASAAVPAPVVKMLSTPKGVSSLTIPAGLALLKGIQDHLEQWSGEDDDDYYDAHDDMAYELGFDDIEDPDGDDKSATEQMWDLLELYGDNPKQAAQQLIKHIQTKAVDPADIKASFKSRADDPNDWRYQNKLKEPEYSEPYDYYASNTPEKNKIVLYTTDFDGNIMDTYIRDNRETDPVQKLKDLIRAEGSSSGSRFYKYTKYTATSGGKPVKIDSEKYIDPSKLSNALSPDQVREKMYKMWEADVEKAIVDKIATAPGTLARAATVAKAGINKLSEPTAVQQMPAKDMGRIKPTAALPAPTQPEIELPVDIKQKQAEPVRRQGNGQDQLTEFDPGEGGFGPFKVYHEDYFVEQFSTFEEAMGEIDFRRNADPKSATHHWRIVDGTGETVWEYDIGDDIDAYRRGQKFQRRS